MELVPNRLSGGRFRMPWQAVLRVLRARPDRSPASARAAGGPQPAVPGAEHSSPDVPEAARLELLSRVRAGLQLVEHQHRLIREQLAEHRYQLGVLQEYAEHKIADIDALEQRQAQLESIATDLRRADAVLNGDVAPPVPHDIEQPAPH
ncbi:MAG TPA: hypothetical protein VKZ96_15870 [Thermomicrobiales bacterium]|nr:hypothetical protein [Thermomicrobiales bacterium]